MATVYSNPGKPHPAINPSPDGIGYQTYKEPDTRVPPKPSSILKAVSVDGVAIPEEAILQEAQHHPADNPGAALKAAAEALVVRQLLLNEADRIGIPAGAGKQDSGLGGPVENNDNGRIRKLTEQAIDVPSASLAECRRFFDNNRQRFKSPHLFEARHILIAAAEEAEADRRRAYELAQGICAKLAETPEAFEALAKLHSDCPSSRQGGNLGQIGPGSTVPEFEHALKAMQPGMVSASPVASAYGYHIIALDRSIEAQSLPFEAVHRQIADWLEAQAWSRAGAQYVSILAGKAEITGIELQGADSPLVQ